MLYRISLLVIYFLPNYSEAEMVGKASVQWQTCYYCYVIVIKLLDQLLSRHKWAITGDQI